jgi:hypothetical protein
MRPEEAPHDPELQVGVDHQHRHLDGDVDNGHRHLDLAKTLPVVHRLLLHLRELKKKRDAGGGST